MRWEATSGLLVTRRCRQVLTCFRCRVRAATDHGANPAHNCASRSCRRGGTSGGSERYVRLLAWHCFGDFIGCESTNGAVRKRSFVVSSKPCRHLPGPLCPIALWTSSIATGRNTQVCPPRKQSCHVGKRLFTPQT